MTPLQDGQGHHDHPGEPSKMVKEIHANGPLRPLLTCDNGHLAVESFSHSVYLVSIMEDWRRQRALGGKPDRARHRNC